MPRILIVDDDAASRSFMARTLADAGHEVTEAEDAHEALRMLLRSRPDVVVVDIVLPSYSGVDVARAIHGMRGSETLPIIAVSGHSQAETLFAPETFGAHALLRKPMEASALVEAVDECLGRDGRS